MAQPAVRRDNLNLMRPAGDQAQSSPGKKFLEELLRTAILDAETWKRLPTKHRLELQRHGNLDRLLLRLVDHKLLSQYQAARLQSGQPESLRLGNYRVLDRLGAGTASVVFKAEQVETGQAVALKVLIPPGQNDGLLLRFDTERRTIAQLDHPHIVRVLDVGEAANSDPDAPLLYYYAMEWVPGCDLEAHVRARGPLNVSNACTLGYQIADALHAAHEHGLVHRDVNPANVLVNVDAAGLLGCAKLLDFGLILSAQARLTQPGACLGLLEYIAPEQAADAARVDIRADLFALGSTLFFALTGRPPFSARGSLLEVLQRRACEPAPSVLELNPRVPAELDAILSRLMALHPDDRFPTPADAMRALEPMLAPGTVVRDISLEPTRSAALAAPPQDGPRVLVLHHDLDLRLSLREAIQSENFWCETADDAQQALDAVRRHQHDVILVEPTPQGCSLLEFLRLARALTDMPHRKILMLTHPEVSADLAAAFAAGADDALALPADPAAIQVRVRCLLHLKQAQDRLVQSARQPTPDQPAPEPTTPEPAKKRGWFGWLLGTSRNR